MSKEKKKVVFAYMPLGFNDHDPDAKEFLNVFLVVQRRKIKATSLNQSKVIYLKNDELFNTEKTIEETLRDKILKWKKRDFSDYEVIVEYCSLSLPQKTDT